jgi:hypothetical protein
MLQRPTVSSASATRAAKSANAAASGPSPAAGGWPASDAALTVADKLLESVETPVH